MADVIDQASDREELDRGLSLMVRKPDGPAATGYCLNCGPDTPLDNGARWCDSDCRDDWQKIHNNGGQ